MNKVRTRFAPSPTGMLHIGGARTALFNSLFAKHHGGEFLLRIEDTDQTRNTPENVQAILDGLKWLDIQPDQPPIFQSQNLERHTSVVAELLAKGKAYRCYCTPAELAEMRAKAEKEKRTFLYNGFWRDKGPESWPENQPYVIRIKAPREEGKVEINDLVQGSVSVENKILDDMILLRSDGMPVYMLAVVVDDHDAGITHVIRGDDHLSNTFRQAMIYDAMGWTRPEFAHLPLIHGPDGKKYSKRHGAEGVGEFKAKGYLAPALNQYLLQLGWWHENLDGLDAKQAVDYFDLTHMNRAAARMDFAKLNHINSSWLNRMDEPALIEDLAERFAKVSSDKKAINQALEGARLILPEMRERAKNLEELAQNALFLLEVKWNEKGENMVKNNSEVLARTLEKLETVVWEKQALHDLIVSQCESEAVKISEIAQPLRAALTGSTFSPPIDATLFALGREESRNRIEQAILLANPVIRTL